MKYGILILGIVLTIIGLILIFRKPKKIVDLKRLYYSYSSGSYMNSGETYELKCDKECILIYRADSVDIDDAKEYKINKKDIKELENKLNELNVGSWDGFHKSNKHVLDGDTFTLNISCKDGTEIESHGYMKYPKNYGNVSGTIMGFFEKYIKE